MKLDQLDRYGVLEPRKGVEPATIPTLMSSLSAQTLEQVFGGETRERSSGSCFVVNNTYSQNHHHGLHRLAQLSFMTGDSFALVCRDPELAYLDLSRTVFLDTETTGLGMGTGTYVFLVGAGYVAQGQFHVRQFFLHGPHEEQPFLDELAEFLDRFSAIVTFNGKSFDWPLLENRFVLHRRCPPFDDPLHVDLLFPARSLWKRRLHSCGLQSLEGQVLQVRRMQEDVPGYLIPQLYFQYQIDGDAALLNRVFYHNLQDVLSLAALGLHIDRLIADPGCGLISEGLDFLSLGRTYDRAGENEMALGCYEEGLRRLSRGRDRQECLVRLSRAQKRGREWEAALQSWNQLLEEGSWGALYARIELAKYYEHVERDYMQAIDHAQYALELVDLYGGSWPKSAQRDLEHRLSRLTNRAIKTHAWLGP